MSKRLTRSTRSTRSTPREKESKIRKTVFPPLPAGDVYEAFAVKTRLVKEKTVWHLTEILKSARKKMVVTYRNRWNVGVERVVYKEIFVDMFKVFNGKDMFIEVMKD